jgi:hypothetical protein
MHRYQKRFGASSQIESIDHQFQTILSITKLHNYKSLMSLQRLSKLINQPLTVHNIVDACGQRRNGDIKDTIVDGRTIRAKRVPLTIDREGSLSERQCKPLDKEQACEPRSGGEHGRFLPLATHRLEYLCFLSSARRQCLCQPVFLFIVLIYRRQQYTFESLHICTRFLTVIPNVKIKAANMRSHRTGFSAAKRLTCAGEPLTVDLWQSSANFTISAHALVEVAGCPVN